MKMWLLASLLFNLIVAVEDDKARLLREKEAVANASSETKGEKLYQLAFTYLKDQDLELAFATFLQALDAALLDPYKEEVDPSVYKHALETYLDIKSPSPQVTAEKLLEEIEPFLQQHSNQKLLDYFIAIAHANLGHYDQFFRHFYRAYGAYPDHYLAFKTKAVLHIKLLERTVGEKERDVQREGIVDNLQKAIEKNPCDIATYKMMIEFSPREKKRQVVVASLESIMKYDVKVPRLDIIFYVRYANLVGERKLEERFLDYVSRCYPNSRIIHEIKSTSSLAKSA